MARDATRSGGESTLTVLLALAANVLVAVAKTIAAVVTGAASMLAEAAHSWADTGNEIFLVVAQRRSARPADRSHPLGYGREVYVWSMFAAIGLFAVGAGVSVTHGFHELADPEPATDFGVAYVVLAVNQVTGSAVPDATGSILVGLLLGYVAFVLIARNLRFLVGQSVDADVQAAALRMLLHQPEVDRVTQLRLEFVGARQVVVTGAVDLTGDPDEVEASRRLAELEARLRAEPGVVGVVLSLAGPQEASLVPPPGVSAPAPGSPGSP